MHLRFYPPGDFGGSFIAMGIDTVLRQNKHTTAFFKYLTFK